MVAPGVLQISRVNSRLTLTLTMPPAASSPLPGTLSSLMAVLHSTVSSARQVPHACTPCACMGGVSRASLCRDCGLLPQQPPQHTHAVPGPPLCRSFAWLCVTSWS